MRYLMLLALLGLAACGTPQERCTRQLSSEARRLDGLIEETRLSIARGYRYETEIRENRFGWSYCNRSRNVGLCIDNQPYTVRRPVAVDTDTEKRKLDQLLLKRQQLTGAQCSATGEPVSVPVR